MIILDLRICGSEALLLRHHSAGIDTPFFEKVTQGNVILSTGRWELVLSKT